MSHGPVAGEVDPPDPLPPPVTVGPPEPPAVVLPPVPFVPPTPVAPTAPPVPPVPGAPPLVGASSTPASGSGAAEKPPVPPALPEEVVPAVPAPPRAASRVPPAAKPPDPPGALRRTVFPAPPEAPAVVATPVFIAPPVPTTPPGDIAASAGVVASLRGATAEPPQPFPMTPDPPTKSTSHRLAAHLPMGARIAEPRQGDLGRFRRTGWWPAMGVGDETVARAPFPTRPSRMLGRRPRRSGWRRPAREAWSARRSRRRRRWGFPA